MFIFIAFLVVGFFEVGVRVKMAEALNNRLNFSNIGDNSGSCNPPAGFIPIQNAEDLRNIDNDLQGNYFLCNDIYLSDEFIPLTGIEGSEGFRGILEGNHETIHNLNINLPKGGPTFFAGAGLFRLINEEGEVRNLNLKNPKINGEDKSAGVIAAHLFGKIHNCSISSSSFGNSYVINEARVGGMVGNLHETGEIEDSYVAKNVLVYGLFSGGLAGQIWGGKVIRSGAEATVYGLGRAGGLVSWSQQYGDILPEIRESYATGDVTSLQQHFHSDAGGLVGFNAAGIISESYATGNVIGKVAGGLVGLNHSFSEAQNGQIQNSYASGNVVGSEISGGFVGQNTGVIEKSYSLGQVMAGSSEEINIVIGGFTGFNDPSYGFGLIISSFFNRDNNPGLPFNDPEGGNVGRTEVELQSLSTYTSDLPENEAWDMTYTNNPSQTVWKLAFPDGSDFPVLDWQLP